MNIEEITSQMQSVMEDKIGSAWTKAQAVIEHLLTQNQADICEITNFYYSKDLNIDEYREEMITNLNTLKNELLILNITDEKTIINAINSAVESIIIKINQT